ncbi:hypothetical protein N8306_01840 [Yoonia sp.]|nr:hypothetical protein [Yoonia sp.]
MSDAYLEKIAGELAELALADEERSGDERIINDIAEIVGSSSQTLQEAFLTSVRVRRAEKRAREILAKRDPRNSGDTSRLLTGDKANAASAPSPQANDEDVDTSDLQSMLDELDQQNARDAGKPSS